MKMILGSRGTGKTKSLIEIAYQEQGVIVCADPVAMLNKVHRYGYLGLEIISYDEFLANQRWLDNKNYFIKNVEELLAKMNVSSCTCTVSFE